HLRHARRPEMRQKRSALPPRCRWIAFDGPEVPLAIDERFAHRPRLRHVNERGVNHCFAVRVIISARVAANFCTFAMLPPREKRQVMHRVENSSLRWLESVARVRQSARNDDRHRVIEERPRDFLGYIYRFDLFVWIQHDRFNQPQASTRRALPRGSALPRRAKSRPLAGLLQADRFERRAAVKFAKNQGRFGLFPHSSGTGFRIPPRMHECQFVERSPARSLLGAVLLEAIVQSTPHQIAVLVPSSPRSSPSKALFEERVL